MIKRAFKHLKNQLVLNFNLQGLSKTQKDEAFYHYYFEAVAQELQIEFDNFYLPQSKLQRQSAIYHYLQKTISYSYI